MVKLRALSAGESRRASACVIQREHKKLGSFYRQLLFLRLIIKKRLRFSVWVQPCPLPGWWLYQRQIKWFNNQVCHTSLQRHRDDLAPLCLSKIKSVMHPKCEVNRPSESTEKADVSFPDEHPKTTRPEFVLYHPGHLIPIWVIVRAQPSCHQSPVFGLTPWVKARSLGAQQQTQSLEFVLPWTVPGFIWHWYSTNGTKHARHHFRIDCKKWLSLCQVKQSYQGYQGLFCFLINHEWESTLCNQPSLNPRSCKKLWLISLLSKSNEHIKLF